MAKGKNKDVLVKILDNSPDISSLEYLDIIIANMPGNVYWKNKEGKCLGCNENFARIIGLPRNEVIGKFGHDFLPKEYADEAYRIDCDIMSQGVERVIEETGKDVDGNKAVYLTRKVPLRNKKGEVVGILGISFDITEFKRFEQQKYKFLRIVSHEIRGPIQNITGLINQMELKKYSKENLVQVLNDISSQTTKTTSLISDAIDLFDLELKKYEGNKPSSVELSQVIKIIKQSVIVPPNVELFVSISPELPNKIIIDILKFNYLVKLLLTNALDEMEQGYVKIDIYPFHYKGKDALYIEIVDTGARSYPKNKDYIFDALGENKLFGNDFYYQKPYIKLTTAKKIVDQLNGEISLNNKKNEYTEIELIIPYQPDKISLNSHQIIECKIENKPVDIIANLNILVVEDDKLTNEIFTNMLSSYKCHIFNAYNGYEALKLIRKNNFDVIFMDITLPDINGVNILREALKFSKQQLKIVAVTSHATKDDINYFHNQGFMTVLPKPVSNKDLKDFFETYTRMANENDQE
jgi:PAS domain S-box-containing protein